VQFIDTFVVGSFGKNFTDTHYFVSGDAYWVLKTVEVPGLKKGHVETDVGWVEICIVDYFVEETGEVFDVVH